MEFSILARRTASSDHWFVSFEAPRQLRLGSHRSPVRQTKTFRTEGEAKEFAKQMLSDKRKVVALTNQHDALSQALKSIDGLRKKSSNPAQ
jgi:hypothetical protein